MARNPEFYRGRKQKRNFWLIPFVLLLALLMLAGVLFYGLQKYAVITDDKVKVVLPGMEAEEGTVISSDGETRKKVYDTVVPDIVFQAPDYSRIVATAGRRVRPIRAMFLDASELSAERLDNAVNSLVDGNALMLEMKPRSGQLVWNSKSKLAISYGLSTDTEFSNSLPDLIPTLKERSSDGKKIWLAAQISCFVDELLGTRVPQFALRTETGFLYTDDTGTWLDPYNSDVRNYIIELAQELFDMGFDEVVLSDVMHPVGATETNAAGETVRAQFLYSREMSTEPNPITAICGFAVYAAEELSERTGLLSIYTDSPRSLVREDEGNGQNAVLFMKIYDRVYYRTDRYTYTYNLQDMQGSVPYGKVNDRFVPVVINLIPHDNSSWVYIERLEA